MKVEIDIENKVIKLKGNFNLEEIIKAIDGVLPVFKELFPKDEWKEYKLKIDDDVDHIPVPIPYQPFIPYPYEPYTIIHF